ncbi:MAG: efflux transporter periplasmic adaptor subunit, partial [Clostridia bacterium]|nr:efflux transporter periplasmic adaptor subunit [Clostridia bacterium]
MNRVFSVKTLILLILVFAVVAGFVFVLLRSGPLAPIPVTVITVEDKSLAPALFGIGTVEARFTHKIGPTVDGRVR